MDDHEGVLKRRVLAELRKKKIKLWITPYCNNFGQKNPDSLDLLATKLRQDLKIQNPEKDVLRILLNLQIHALQKLSKEQYKLEVQIMGMNISANALTSYIDSCFLSDWGDKVEVIDSNKGCIIHIHNVSSGLSTKKIMQDLMKELEASRVRFIFKGKMIPSSDDNFRVLLACNKTTERNVLLCLASGTRQMPSSSSETTLSSEGQEDVNLISSIRRAATHIQSNARFEITDQQGKLVSMSRTDNVAFLCALGFHRMGRERMNQPLNALDSSLLFFLEADSEWSNAQGLESWKGKVDNYGLLQLDIAWIYLKMGNLDSLPDALRRLEVAEKSLQKQVNSNFLTLALVQADMGNPVPPISAIFVRLFLLQGVALKYSTGESDKSKERLDWAYALCRQLRVVAPMETANQLSDMLNVSTFAAIAALRKVNGDISLAGDLISSKKEDTAREERTRRCQQRLGLCRNEKDYVDLDLIPKLQSLLNLPQTLNMEKDDEICTEDWNTRVVVGILRLSDNSLENAIDLYQEVNQIDDLILRRISDLDKKLNADNIMIGIHKQKESLNDVAVDDIALTILTSMGVSEERVRKALAKTENNVDMSLLYLSNDETSNCAIAESNSSKSKNQESMGCNSTSATEKIPNNCEQETSESCTLTIPKLDKRFNQTAELESEKEKHREHKRAQMLLEKELGCVLQEADLEKEWLGLGLDEEWNFIEKYRKSL
mmetsp:Transcript_7171/g.8931  ORF Transcript_7171/g.8931 Transcript_7171/m.8931 type:complete len:717 (+) Transcript_7171:120-2270(+)